MIQVLTVLLYTFSSIILLATVLPFIQNSYWVFRVFEYPRFQKLILSSVLLAGWLFIEGTSHPAKPYFIAALALSIGYLLYKIFPYTGVSTPEMKKAKPSQEEDRVRVFGGNVLQDNTNYEGFLRLIRQTDPDLVLLLETDKGWEAGLADLEKDYPYTEKKALDNTYGMLFYSRLPIVQSRIRFLAEEDVPSLDAIIQLRSGQKVHIWGLHPKPPLPNENPRSEAKDKELMKIALEARKEELPVIVLGDLNDVAWSYTTELFRKTSELLDPRRGRGFYSTFNANHWWVRFPLDYLFASTHFTLVHMKRLPPNGSDHFPILVELQYSQAATRQQEAPKADEEDLQNAKEAAHKPVTE